MTRTRRLLTRPWLLGVLAAALVVAGAGLYWFQPWQLWVDETVQEDLPPAAAAFCQWLCHDSILSNPTTKWAGLAGPGTTLAEAEKAV